MERTPNASDAGVLALHGLRPLPNLLAARIPQNQGFLVDLGGFEVLDANRSCPAVDVCAFDDRVVVRSGGDVDFD